VSPDDIQELFSQFGPVSVRRMFGGAGIYADGIMIGLVADGLIYLKVDEATAPDYEREGLPPFTYTSGNRRETTMSYRRMPDRLYDDPEELVRWARGALAAAKRSAAQHRRDAKAKGRAKAKKRGGSA
jgi:DNA transformation protein